MDGFCLLDLWRVLSVREKHPEWDAFGFNIAPAGDSEEFSHHPIHPITELRVIR
jgi:hypothetical protein